LGWIGSERPQMISVQAAGCAPVVKAWDEGAQFSEMWKGATTHASGLRVPKPYGDYIILDILRKSGGVAIAVSEEEITDAVRHWARVEGVFAAPEGAAALAAYRKLRDSCFFDADDTVVLFNTGSGLKYLDTFDAGEAKKKKLPVSRQIAGIIGPY
jgi:threonine synthase